MKTRNRWLTLGLSGGVLAAIFLMTEQTAWSVGPTHPMENVEKAIQDAKTQSDHEALAAHYEAEAKGLEEKAEMHKRMSKAYADTGGYPAIKGGALMHCDSLAAGYGQAAQENLELAKMHRQMAEEAAK